MRQGGVQLMVRFVASTWAGTLPKPLTLMRTVAKFTPLTPLRCAVIAGISWGTTDFGWGDTGKGGNGVVGGSVPG